MRPGTRQLLDDAGERLEVARLGVAAGIGTPVAGVAYYAAFDAARAALSEENRFARRHSGVWALFGETFVVPGRFDPRLYAALHAMQERREDPDYPQTGFSAEEARAVFETCERFVAAVEEMLGA